MCNIYINESFIFILRRYINESHNKQKQKRTLNPTIYCMLVSKSKNVDQFNVILLSPHTFGAMATPQV